MSKPITVSIEVDQKKLSELVSKYKDAASKASDRAESRALKKLNTDLIRATGKVLALKRDEITKKFELSPRGPSLYILRGGFSLRAFLRKQEPQRAKKVGLKVRIYKGKAPRLFPGSFAAYGASGNLQVFKRSKLSQKARFPLTKLTAIGPRDLWTKDHFRQPIIDEAIKTYNERFKSNFDMLVSRAS